MISVTMKLIDIWGKSRLFVLRQLVVICVLCQGFKRFCLDAVQVVKVLSDKHALESFSSLAELLEACNSSVRFISLLIRIELVQI